MAKLPVRKELDDYIYVERTDLQIVDPALFGACKAMGRAEHPNEGATGPRKQFILSSKVRCPQCGTIMRVVRDRSGGTRRQLTCPNGFGPERCAQHWRFDLGALENIVIGEGLAERYLQRRSEFAKEARIAFQDATKGQSQLRAALLDEKRQLERSIETAAANSAMAGEYLAAANLRIIREAEARLSAIQEELSGTGETINFPEDDATLQGMEGVLDILHKEAPFLPVTPEEFDVRDFLRKVVASVEIRWTENDRADVVVNYDMGALHSAKTRIPITRVYHDREVLFHRLLRSAAKQKTEQAAGADRYALGDAEWKAKPYMEAFTSSCQDLPCRGRRLIDALLLSVEMDRPREEAMKAKGIMTGNYERALDTIRMSSEIEDLIGWLASLRPHVEDWQELRIATSKLPSIRMRFESHPMAALDLIGGERPVALDDAKWETLAPRFRPIPRYSLARTRGFVDNLLELLRTGAETKRALGSAYAAKAFGTWLVHFERRGNLEVLSRALLTGEGKDTGPDRYPRLPPGRSARSDSKRKKAAVKRAQ